MTRPARAGRDIVRSRAAASSSANGRPPSIWQSPATAGSSPGPGSRPCSAIRRRSSPAAAPGSSGSRLSTRSPARPSGRRDVMIMRTPGHDRAIRSTRRPQPAQTCSALSRTSSSSRGRSPASRASGPGWAGPGGTPAQASRARLTARRSSVRCAGSVPSSATATPSANSAARHPAVCRASSVLPTPGGPTSVIARCARTAWASARWSASRPVSGPGEGPRPAQLGCLWPRPESPAGSPPPVMPADRIVACRSRRVRSGSAPSSSRSLRRSTS